MPTEPIKMEDIGTKYQYFEYNDLPARKLAPNSRPEVYRPGKGWVPVKSTWDFMHSYTIADEARINEMIARLG